MEAGRAQRETRDGDFPRGRGPMALGAVRARRWGSPGSGLRTWMDACGQSMVPGRVSVGRAQSGLCHGLHQGLCGLAGAQSLGTACWGCPPALAQSGHPLGPASPTPLQPVSPDSARRPPTVLGSEAARQHHPRGQGWPGPPALSPEREVPAGPSRSRLLEGKAG